MLGFAANARLKAHFSRSTGPGLATEPGGKPMTTVSPLLSGIAPWVKVAVEEVVVALSQASVLPHSPE